MKETVLPNGGIRIMDKQKRLAIYFPLYFLFITVCVVLRTVACLTRMDYDTGFYTDTLINVANYITLGGVLVLFTFAPFSRRMGAPVPDLSSPLAYISSGIFCVVLGFMGAYLFRTFTSAAEGNATMLGHALPTLAYILTLLCAVLAFVSLIYFIIICIDDRRHGKVHAGFCVGTALFFAAYAALLFFNNASPLNDPAKITDQMAYLSAALFFLYETRIPLQREKWHLYGGFGLVCGLLCAYAAIPSLITYAVRSRLINDNFYSPCLLALLFVFVTTRLFLFARWKDAALNPKIKWLLKIGQKVKTANEQDEATAPFSDSVREVDQ